MIPGADHSSRSLLFRRIRSWSQVAHRTTHEDVAETTNGSSDGNFNISLRPLLQISSSDACDEIDGNNVDLTSPLLPQGLSLEYEEQSHRSFVVDDEEDHSRLQYCASTITATDWKLWIVFALLVASGVGNVIFAKLQSLPMYNYPTFLNIYANGMYALMSFAYILPVSALGLFGNSLQRSMPTKAIKPFFVMGALDALGASMQVLATVYLPGTLLVLIPQVAIPLSMVAGSLVLHEKYTVRQYIGATVVFCGILVVLFPILSHQRDAEFYCKAIDTESDCLLCNEETTQELCLFHNTKHNGTSDNSTQQQEHLNFWRGLELNSSSGSGSGSNNATDDGESNDGLYCAWVSREEANSRDEDFLVLFWSIVMLLSCIPSVMSTVYKQVALQTPSSMDPIVISGWVSLFQFVCGLFLVIPSGMVSSPRVHPLELRSNWWNGMGCLFAKLDSIDSGCHPDHCAQAALWVHVSLLNSAVYALSMLYVLKYGSCDLLYLGLTLVVPLGHLAFDVHSSFSELRAYDTAGLVILVVGLVLYRFGHIPKNTTTTTSGEASQYSYEQPLVSRGDNDRAGSGNGNAATEDATENDPLEPFQRDQEGFLKFLREPFMLVGDI